MELTINELRKLIRNMLSETTSQFSLSFRTISEDEALEKYGEAPLRDHANDHMDLELGEIMVPVYGWGHTEKLCTIQGGQPVEFYDKNNGWRPIPDNANFVKEVSA